MIGFPYTFRVFAVCIGPVNVKVQNPIDNIILASFKDRFFWRQNTVVRTEDLNLSTSMKKLATNNLTSLK